MSGLQRQPIFAALTRPQLVGGVTYGYALFNLIATIEAFLLLKSFWVLLLAPLIHVAGRLMCRHDPRLFDIWILRVSRCPRVRNHRHWSANSYRP